MTILRHKVSSQPFPPPSQYSSLSYWLIIKKTLGIHRRWGWKLDFEVDYKIRWCTVSSGIDSHTPRFSLNTASGYICTQKDRAHSLFSISKVLKNYISTRISLCLRTSQRSPPIHCFKFVSSKLYRGNKHLPLCLLVARSIKKFNTANCTLHLSSMIVGGGGWGFLPLSSTDISYWSLWRKGIDGGYFFFPTINQELSAGQGIPRFHPASVSSKYIPPHFISVPSLSLFSIPPPFSTSSVLSKYIPPHFISVPSLSLFSFSLPLNLFSLI